MTRIVIPGVADIDGGAVVAVTHNGMPCQIQEHRVPRVNFSLKIRQGKAAGVVVGLLVKAVRHRITARFVEKLTSIGPICCMDIICDHISTGEFIWLGRPIPEGC